MQIGIISDVHADYAALEDVLDRFVKHHNVDQILCAGDIVGRGPDPDRVVDLIRARRIPVARVVIMMNGSMAYGKRIDSICEACPWIGKESWPAKRSTCVMANRATICGECTATTCRRPI